MPSLPIEWNSNRGASAGIIAAMNLDYSDHNRELGRLYGRHIECLCERHDRALEMGRYVKKTAYALRDPNRLIRMASNLQNGAE